MDEIFKGLPDKAPDIIATAAQSPLGLASLSVLVLGVVGVFLFRGADGKLKLAAFAMIITGFLGFMVLVVVPVNNKNHKDSSYDKEYEKCLQFLSQRPEAEQPWREHKRCCAAYPSLNGC